MLAFFLSVLLISRGKGRYNKFTRKLSQTPWIIQGKRKTETSLEELICLPAKQFFDADGYTFVAAGREDVDVRTLGTGRPFVVEIKNPRRAYRPADDYADLQEEINRQTTLIRVRDIQPVSKDCLTLMKEGEERKRKSYRCLVHTSRPLTCDDLKKLDQLSLARKEDTGDSAEKEEDACAVLVYQDTPVRVLHRRTLATRLKRIFRLAYVVVNSHFLLMDLEAQAGTYIKEFIHGDLGRTVPNLGSILGCQCDILSLDVTQIKLDFPTARPERDDGSNVSFDPKSIALDLLDPFEKEIVEDGSATSYGEEEEKL